MSKDTKLPTHKAIREQLLIMQNKAGGMFNPFALRKIFFDLIKRDNIQCTSTPFQSARLAAETYCALANEFFLLNSNKKTEVRETFYITQSRWDKYLISPEERNWSINFLHDYGLVTYEIKTVPPENKLTTVYTLNEDRLKMFHRILDKELD